MTDRAARKKLSRDVREAVHDARYAHATELPPLDHKVILTMPRGTEFVGLRVWVEDGEGGCWAWATADEYEPKAPRAEILEIYNMTERAERMNDGGESTANWAMRKPGFFGTITQLTCCARCGDVLPSGQDTQHKMFRIFTPAVHCLCDPCFDELPE